MNSGMTSAIGQLQNGLQGVDVGKWFEGREFPIVEGDNAAFVWRGKVDGVTLRHFIFGLESARPLARIENTDVWYLVMEIPRKSRVEYKFEIHIGENSKWVEDPLNPHRARDPFGANSVFQGEGYENPDWIHPDPNVRRGSLQRFEIHSEAFGDKRGGHIYLPARFRENRRYPIAILHDGKDYLNYSGMKVVLDNLIDRLEIPDIIVVFTDSNDRLKEYADDARHARYLTEELYPYLKERFPLRDVPRARCLMGASFGGVAALSTAARYPGFWGRLLLQSGSFAFTDIGTNNRRGPVFDPVVEFMNAFRAGEVAVSERVFVSCGVYESLIYENRSLVPLLDESGMQVRFVEARDGHNWENWRDRSREGLSWLFRGPLMMIYE